MTEFDVMQLAAQNANNREIENVGRLKLTWHPTRFEIFGDGFELQGLPPKDSGSARKHGDRFIAHAYIGNRYLSHTAKTLKSAMSRLEKEIDRQSIGLLGVDDLEFVRDA